MSENTEPDNKESDDAKKKHPNIYISIAVASIIIASPFIIYNFLFKTKKSDINETSNLSANTGIENKLINIQDAMLKIENKIEEVDKKISDLSTKPDTATESGGIFGNLFGNPTKTEELPINNAVNLNNPFETSQNQLVQNSEKDSMTPNLDEPTLEAPIDQLQEQNLESPVAPIGLVPVDQGLVAAPFAPVVPVAPQGVDQGLGVPVEQGQGVPGVPLQNLELPVEQVQTQELDQNLGVPVEQGLVQGPVQGLQPVQNLEVPKIGGKITKRRRYRRKRQSQKNN